MEPTPVLWNGRQPEQRFPFQQHEISVIRMHRKQSGDIAMSRFSDYVQQRYAKSTSPLPLVHSTTAYRFPNIEPTDRIIPGYCKVFGEDITYLFYGRPAYKSKDSINSPLEFNWPIVFLFYPHVVGKITRIYPFDTGAFDKGVYHEFFHSDSNLKDFELNGDINNAHTLIQILYTSEYKYFFGIPDRNIQIEPMEFEIQGLQSLNRIPGQNIDDSGLRRDERSTSIEIHIGTDINLKDNLLGLIAPQRYLENPKFANALARWKPKYKEFYEPVFNLTSDSISGSIYKIICDIYKSEGLLHE